MTAEAPDTSEVIAGVRSLRVPARVDDALRALLVLAAAPPRVRVKLTQVSEVEGISPRFLSTVLVALRDHGLVHSHRGAMGGYWLARPAAEITVADVYDAVDLRDPVPVPGSQVTGDLWHQLETELRARLEAVTVADLLAFHGPFTRQPHAAKSLRGSLIPSRLRSVSSTPRRHPLDEGCCAFRRMSRRVRSMGWA